MTSGKRNDLNRQIDALAVQLHATIRAINTAVALTSELSDASSKPVQTPFKVASLAAKHLSEHRPGRPSKIDCDPDLRAFLSERIATMTVPALGRAVADHFPPERRVKKTAINDWWHRTRKRIPKSDPE